MTGFTHGAAQAGAVVRPHRDLESLSRRLAQAPTPAESRRSVQAAAGDVERRAAARHRGREGRAQLASDFRALGEIADGLEGEERKILAAAFARGLDERRELAFRALAKVAADPSAPTFTVDLVAALRDEGKTEGANRLTRALCGELRGAARDLEGAMSEVVKVSAALEQAAAPFRPVLSSAQEQSGAEAFRQLHRVTYEAFERAQADALRLLDVARCAVNALGSEAQAAPRVRELLKASAALIEQMSLSKNLAKLVADDLQGPEEESFFARLSEMASHYSSVTGMIEPVGAVVVHAVGARAVSLAAQGDSDAALEAIALLTKARPLFGVDEDQMRELTDSLGEVLSAEGDRVAPALATFRAKTENIDAKSSHALVALGLALSLPGLIQDWSEFGSATAKERIATVLETVSEVAGVGSLTIEILGAAETLGVLSAGFRWVAGGVGLISGALGALETGEEVRRGRYWNAINLGAGAASTLTFGVNGFIALGPPALVAASVLAGGAVASGAARKVVEKDRDRRELAAFLEGALGSQAVARDLSHTYRQRTVMPFLERAAKLQETDLPSLFQEVVALDPKRRSELVMRAVRANPDEPGSRLDWLRHAGEPSFDDTLIDLRRRQLLP